MYNDESGFTASSDPDDERDRATWRVALVAGSVRILPPLSVAFVGCGLCLLCTAILVAEDNPDHRQYGDDDQKHDGPVREFLALARVSTPVDVDRRVSASTVVAPAVAAIICGALHAFLNALGDIAIARVG